MYCTIYNICCALSNEFHFIKEGSRYNQSSIKFIVYAYDILSLPIGCSFEYRDISKLFSCSHPRCSSACAASEHSACMYAIGKCLSDSESDESNSRWNCGLLALVCSFFYFQLVSEETNPTIGAHLQWILDNSEVQFRLNSLWYMNKTADNERNLWLAWPIVKESMEHFLANDGQR